MSKLTLNSVAEALKRKGFRISRAYDGGNKTLAVTPANNKRGDATGTRHFPAKCDLAEIMEAYQHEVSQATKEAHPEVDEPKPAPVDLSGPVESSLGAAAPRQRAVVKPRERIKDPIGKVIVYQRGDEPWWPKPPFEALALKAGELRILVRFGGHDVSLNRAVCSTRIADL